MTADTNPPRVKPTRGAPSFLKDADYRSNGTLLSIGSVMWKEKSGPAPTALDWSAGWEKSSEE